jgi:hypothetical protein
VRLVAGEALTSQRAGKAKQVWRTAQWARMLELVTTDAEAPGGEARTVGFVLGVCVIVFCVVDLFQEWSSEKVFFSIPPVAYLAGVVLTVPRASRLIGQGMLIGLTTAIAMAIFIWVLLYAANGE